MLACGYVLGNVLQSLRYARFNAASPTLAIGQSVCHAFFADLTCCSSTTTSAAVSGTVPRCQGALDINSVLGLNGEG